MLRSALFYLLSFLINGALFLFNKEDADFLIYNSSIDGGVATIDELLDKCAVLKDFKAVQEGKVYSQISFRSFASNLETALADAYYAASLIYPERFKDIDHLEKTEEIFIMLLGSNPYEALKEAGYEFCPIQIGR